MPTGGRAHVAGPNSDERDQTRRPGALRATVACHGGRLHHASLIFVDTDSKTAHDTATTERQRGDSDNKGSKDNAIVSTDTELLPC